MDSKTAGMILVIAASFFLIGRTTAPEKIKVEKEFVAVTTYKENIDKQFDINATTTTISKPDGTKVTRTKRTDRSKETKATSSREIQYKTEIKEIIKSSPTSVMLVATNGLDYGLSLSRQVLGPITIGIFAFKSGVFGASIGVNF